jgi:hypothetical protein
MALPKAKSSTFPTPVSASPLMPDSVPSNAFQHVRFCRREGLKNADNKPTMFVAEKKYNSSHSTSSRLGPNHEKVYDHES